jgi:hypothetical protein
MLCRHKSKCRLRRFASEDTEFDLTFGEWCALLRNSDNVIENTCEFCGKSHLVWDCNFTISNHYLTKRLALWLKRSFTQKHLTLDYIDKPVYRTRKLIELRRTRTTPLWLEGIFSLPSWWNWSVASSELREFNQPSDAFRLPCLLYVDLYRRSQSDFLTYLVLSGISASIAKWNLTWKPCINQRFWFIPSFYTKTVRMSLLITVMRSF